MLLIYFVTLVLKQFPQGSSIKNNSRFRFLFQGSKLPTLAKCFYKKVEILDRLLLVNLACWHIWTY